MGWCDVSTLLRRGLTLTLIVLVLAAYPKQPGAGSPADLTIEEQIDRMSADERVAQLMIVSFLGTKPSADLQQMVAEWRVGGVVLYAYNVGPVHQVQHLTAAIRNASGPIPPFIAIDQEGGIVRRLHAGVPRVPSQMALGATGSPDLARRAGLSVGTALRKLGFTMNFAPVLDTLPASGSAELGTRAFGNQPLAVAELGIAFVEGQKTAGIISVGKHFPGQGRAVEDAHRVLPIVDISRHELETHDLVPFRLTIERGLPMIMTTHVSLPRITGKADMPATLSDTVMTKILRTDLGFRGVAISDALQMKAVSQSEVGQTAVQAVLAGCDMVLVPGRPSHRQAVLDGLRRAYADGTLTEDRLRESLKRILVLKSMRLEQAPPERDDGNIVRDIAARAVTVIGDEAILVTARREVPVYVGPAGALQQRISMSRAVIMPPKFTANSRRRLRERTMMALTQASVWVAAVETDEQWQFMEEISTTFRELPTVYVNLGSPYRRLDGRRVVSVLTYSSASESQQAAADVINGIAQATGVPPVSLGPSASGH